MSRWFLVQSDAAPLEVEGPLPATPPAASQAAPVPTSQPEGSQPALPAEGDVFHDGAPSALDFLDHLNGGDGIVVNEALARESPCVAFELGARKLVFSKGVVGALDESQQALYCPTTETRPLSAKQTERLRAFRESAESCRVMTAELAKGERLSPFLRCMETELRQRGHRL